MASRDKYCIGIIWALIAFAFIRCHPDSNRHKDSQLAAGTNTEEKVLTELNKYGCKKEYDFARLYLYASYYQITCIGSLCKRIDGSVYPVGNGNMRLPSTNIRLDVNNDNPIKVYGDTIVFRIFAFSSDSIECQCHYSNQYLLPAGIYVKKGTCELIKSVGYSGFGIFLDSTHVASALTDKAMLKYVKRNANSVNGWFLSELTKRGYLKE